MTRKAIVAVIIITIVLILTNFDFADECLHGEIQLLHSASDLMRVWTEVMALHIYFLIIYCCHACLP